MKKTFFILFFLFSALFCNAQTKIDGFAPKYAGEKITFCTYENYITHESKILATCSVDKLGNFSASVDLSCDTYIFTRLGKYVFYFFVQPQSSIKIEFAERDDLSAAEKLNPFFEPVFVAANIDNSPDAEFCKQLLNIDKQSDNVVYAMLKTQNPSRQMRDSLLTSFGKSFAPSSNAFIQNYASYRTANIEYTLKLKSADSLQTEYFVSKPILYNNPAYFEIFNLLHEKYFLHLSQRRNGNDFRTAVNSGNINNVREILQKNANLSDNNFCDLLILQNTYNEFYDSNFSRSGLLKIVDAIATAGSDANSKIAKNIHDKITKNLVGYNPNDFELYDVNGKKYNLQSFAGKCLYLGFVSVNSYGSIQDLYLIDKLQRKYGNKIQFVSICVDDKSDIKNFLQTEHFNWLFLDYANQPSVIKDYDVRTFPTYYLIDKNGTLLKSPAPSPNENVEQIFDNL